MHYRILHVFKINECCCDKIIPYFSFSVSGLHSLFAIDMNSVALNIKYKDRFSRKQIC